MSLPKRTSQRGMRRASLAVLLAASTLLGAAGPALPALGAGLQGAFSISPREAPAAFPEASLAAQTEPPYAAAPSPQSFNFGAARNWSPYGPSAFTHGVVDLSTAGDSVDISALPNITVNQVGTVSVLFNKTWNPPPSFPPPHHHREPGRGRERALQRDVEPRAVVRRGPRLGHGRARPCRAGGRLHPRIEHVARRVACRAPAAGAGLLRLAFRDRLRLPPVGCVRGGDIPERHVRAAQPHGRGGGPRPGHLPDRAPGPDEVAMAERDGPLHGQRRPIGRAERFRPRPAGRPARGRGPPRRAPAVGGRLALPRRAPLPPPRRRGDRGDLERRGHALDAGLARERALRECDLEPARARPRREPLRRGHGREPQPARLDELDGEHDGGRGAEPRLGELPERGPAPQQVAPRRA